MKVFLFSLLSGAALLLLVEAALALLFQDRIRYENPFAQPAYQFDSETIIGIRRNVERTFYRAEENGGEQINWRVNSAGYRGEELRTDGSPRIVVYGDSNVQARFSKHESTFPAQLEKKLHAARGKQVEVVNAGVIGFGPDQNVLRMARELSSLKPEVVVLQLFADNDFGDLIRNRLFELSPEDELIRTQFEATPDEWLARDRSRRLSRFARSLLSVRMLTRLLPSPAPHGDVADDGIQVQRELVRKQLAQREAEYAIYASKSAREVSHFADSYDIDIALEPSGDIAREKFALMREVLARAKQLTEDHGARLIVLIQPSVVDMTDANAPLGKTFLSQYPGYRPETLSNTLEDLSRDAGVDVLNLYDLFLANNPESLYFSGSNDHWNDAGQALAADATAAFIVKF